MSNAATDDVRISLIIAAHNAAATLSATLWSVVAQSRQPYEVIVVDDGSTDDTVEVADAFADLLPIRVLSHTPNRGVGLTRRVGCEAAVGDALTFVDSDDLLLPDHLEQLSAIYTGPGCIAAGRIVHWVPGSDIEVMQPGFPARIPGPSDQRIGILRGAFIHCASLFSAVDYRAVDGFRDLRTSEDWDVWIQLIHAGARVVQAPLPTMLYRRQETSLTHANLAALAMCDREVLEFHLPRLRGRERRFGNKMLRRRRARALLIAGQQSAASGKKFKARRQWFHAALIDRDLRRPRPGYDSSVTAPALIRLLQPNRDAECIKAIKLDGINEGSAQTCRPSTTVVVHCGQTGGNDQDARLRTTLAGIAIQTVPPNEVIVVANVGSTSPQADLNKVINDFSRHFPLRLILCRNNCVGTGVAAATGQAIALASEGDFWLPEHLAALHEVWNERTIAVARCLRGNANRTELNPTDDRDKSIELSAVLRNPLMLSTESYRELHIDPTKVRGSATTSRATLVKHQCAQPMGRQS